MHRLFLHLTRGLALMLAGIAMSAHGASTDDARGPLGNLQVRVRQLAASASGSDWACQEAKRALRDADAVLVGVDLDDQQQRRGATAAAQRAQAQADAACRQQAEDERHWQGARKVLRDAMASFEQCAAAPANGPCQRVISLAKSELDAQGPMAMDQLRPAAVAAQAAATLLQEQAAVATRLSAKAVSDSQNVDPKADEARRQQLSDTAQTSYRAAQQVRAAADGAAALSWSLTDDALAAPACEASAPGCLQNEEARRTRVKALAAELARRQADADAALEVAKLASFQVQAGVLSASGSERAAMLRFLQLVDRNPDAKGLFGGEAVRFSAGKRGGEASIRVDLDRFAGSPARDASLILSAPVGEDSSAALYDSVDGTASGLTATFEPPRVSRRLNTLRGLSHEQVEQVLARGA